MPSTWRRLKERVHTPRWRIPPLAPCRRGEALGLETRWANETLWFESRDVELWPTPEPLAAVSLLPSLDRGARVILDEPIDEELRAGLARLSEIYRDWWPLRGTRPIETPPSLARDAARLDAATPSPGRTTLCFTGGVDSFHTLLRGPSEVHTLLFVHGYDIPLDDEVRMRDWEASLRAIASTWGTRAVVMRTNLRNHRAFRRVSWEWSHGGALVAAAMLLGDATDRLRISSSFAHGFLQPWGSHPETDPLWSTARLRVEHWGEELLRFGKLAEIVDEPIVQQHLRVCYENRSPSGNCSRCQKCLRTMTAIAGMGRLEEFIVFDQSIALPKRLEAIDRVPRHLELVWRELLEFDLAADVRAQVERILREP